MEIILKIIVTFLLIVFITIAIVIKVKVNSRKRVDKSKTNVTQNIRNVNGDVAGRDLKK